jgi:RND family efflux transporter MFP subunit
MILSSLQCSRAAAIGLFALSAAGLLSSCGKIHKVQAKAENTSPEPIVVGTMSVRRGPVQRQLTVSSELVPFQEIDVYAKESGYVKKLNVDYGTHVKAGQVLAVLEIPELEVTLKQDEEAIRRMTEQVTHAEHELGRIQAQHHVAHLQYDRLASVAKTQPGLVAQQEVDDAQGKDLALESQVEATKSALQVVQSQLAEAQSRRDHDQVIYDYAKITAPFAGVVTQRFANYGTLVQAGTSSSTQAMPIVRLSEDDLFRLVIPVPESYVKFIRLGDPVTVRVPSLDKTLKAKVARFSVDVLSDTRTMHTEVDVPNPNGAIIPGVYAEATLMLQDKPDTLQVPVQAVNRIGDKTTVYVVNSDNSVQELPVTLGLQNTDSVEVLSGLNQGQQVIVSDRSGLKPGEKVKPQAIRLMQYQGAAHS